MSSRSRQGLPLQSRGRSSRRIIAAAITAGAIDLRPS
jgi:hypothetical protein